LVEWYTALKLFISKYVKRKVSIFGSGRVNNSLPNYKLAFKLTQVLLSPSELSSHNIPSARGRVMVAVNQGAGPGNSYGLNMKLPM
jgi:hypothetical protein